MRKLFTRFSILFIITIFSTISTSAATITVSNTNDSGAGSLRQAVIDATSYGRIDFSVTGTILLTSGQIRIDKDLTIIGPGATNLAIDGNSYSRIFTITSGITVNISSVTIQNGDTGTGNGGGIRNLGTLTVTNSTLSDNSAKYGGGIYNDGFGSVMVTNSTLSDNSTPFLPECDDCPSPKDGGDGDEVRSGGRGGGIYNTPFGDVTVTNSTLSGNSADIGGGIFITGSVTVTNSTLSRNSAIFGGGIYNGVNGGVTVTNSTLSGNSATDSGGGIWSISAVGDDQQYCVG